MAWSGSKAFAATGTDWFNRTTTLDANSNTIKVTNYNNSITPDNTVASANTAYNVGQWALANEVTSTGWPAGGLTLAGVSSGFATATYTFDANDRAGGATDTMTNVYGCLVFDATSAAVTNQGYCYNYFGGANSVVAGTFTIVFNAAGIWTGAY